MNDDVAGIICQTLVAGVGAAALEAVTAQLDNAFLPLHFVALSQLTLTAAALRARP